jgi:starch-binding outer membrane protein, SusD/RagB family
MEKINDFFNYIIKNIRPKSLIIAGLLILLACDEKDFLKEVPLDFSSPENVYVTYENFESAVMNLYYWVRWSFYERQGNDHMFPSISWGATEMTYTHVGLSANKPNWQALLLPTSTNVVYEGAWQPAYRLIYDANVIIERAESEFSQMNEDQKKRIIAEASFFRAWAYRMLAHLYGGVPIVLEETKSPKRDYTRASREEVYEQCVIDFKFAAENLREPQEVDDSRISNLTAYHYLAEIYISLGKWQDAINAATVVIDHSSTKLMTARFGTRANEPGDVYWDLFRQGNQNRSSGNSESLWVLQYEFKVPGGGADGGFNLERMIIPRLWRTSIRNPNGSTASITPHPNTYYYGRGSGQQRPSHYFFEIVWRKSGYNQDIRNSGYNILRDFKVNNPASNFNGKWVIADKVPIKLTAFNDTIRDFYPVIAKASTPGKHPAELWHTDQTVPGSLTSDAAHTFRDQYILRLAETYLLRAEAYLGNNNKILAAGDINVVRRRANAPDIDATSVTIDYILDERIRELHFEELYLLTTARLGKTVERAKLYNAWIGDSYQPHNNLWPIPFDEIEKNVEGKLEQNPGY